MSHRKLDKYGRGSAAQNGAGFVDFAPGDTFGMTKDAESERTPRGETAPFQNLASLAVNSITYSLELEQDWRARYFAANALSCNWYDIVDPMLIMTMPTIDLGCPTVVLADRHAIKAAFKNFGVVTNEADGLKVVFPAASAGKMLYQSGTDIRTIAASFKMLFEKSWRAWNEKEVPMPDHKFHFNVSAYSNYISKFRMADCEYFVRFTIRKIGQESSVHASTISEVAVYRKTEGTQADSHLENPEDGDRMPFIDNKISFFLSACQGGSDNK